MPNQCVHCSEIYDDGSGEVLSGCSKCGSRFFFYMSEEKLQKLKKSKEEKVEDLSPSDKKQIEKDVRDIAGIEDVDAPVVLDFESVKILKPGKYVLDIANLFSKERPLIYKLEEGKYVIDLAAQINALKQKLGI
jgi:predicted  nucleic acid-binding Zn-ribbon protein